jgi:Carboxypeptidase regulatory-like domain
VRAASRLFVFAIAVLTLIGCSSSTPTTPTPTPASATTPTPAPAPVLITFDISGVVHESAPTEDVVLSGATVGIHFVGCPTCPHDNQSTTTDDAGHFTLTGLETAGFMLVVSKPGYDTVSYGIVELPRDQHPTIGVQPTGRVLSIAVSGRNDCVDLPSVSFNSDPGGLGFGWGGRVYARLPVHHDGVIRVASSGLVTPFDIGCCPGYVTRLHSDGHAEYWRYVYLDRDLPVEGGFVYLVTFTGDFDYCQPWGMNATAPN